jgi:hypothetical protein
MFEELSISFSSLECFINLTLSPWEPNKGLYTIPFSYI